MLLLFASLFRCSRSTIHFIANISHYDDKYVLTTLIKNGMCCFHGWYNCDSDHGNDCGNGCVCNRSTRRRRYGPPCTACGSVGPSLLLLLLQLLSLLLPFPLPTPPPPPLLRLAASYAVVPGALPCILLESRCDRNGHDDR